MGISTKTIQKINDLILDYASGNFDKKTDISSRRNELDTVVTGINMLGEELLKTTISRNYFSSIYNAVADMLFVVSSKGMIENVNHAVYPILNFRTTDLIGQPISKLTFQNHHSFFSDVKKQLSTGEKSCTLETKFISSDKKIIPVACSCSKIVDYNNNFKGYLIVADDITERKENEKLILRTIVDTQEKEQKRVAEDLHDSFGQELSTTRLLISALDNNNFCTDKKFKEALNDCKSMLDNSIVHLKKICFNLMPSSLEKAGINEAINEILKQLKRQNLIQLHFDSPHQLPTLIKPLEIVIYRVIQEFINNTIKHAKAKNIYIKLLHDTDNIMLTLKDDGCGFDTAKLNNGRGLSNISSRISAFNGTFKITSKINEGTNLLVTFPVNQ